MRPTHREAVVNAFVFVHQTLHEANARLSKRGGQVMAITPRHYLDFINHYVSPASILSVPCAVLVQIICLCVNPFTPKILVIPGPVLCCR